MRSVSSFDLKVTVKKIELLDRLKVNLLEHKQIYKEAVEGFKIHARKQLEDLLGRCNGKEQIYLSLSAPEDHSSAYTTVIGMLEMATDTEIELSAKEYRNLVEDKWDWMEDWLLSNRAYSSTAGSKLAK